MATWNSRGLRGSLLEELINRTNEKYREQHLALIQKIPTPITPVRMDKETRRITLAYFEHRSTVDYIGAVQGIPVCFDAKECRTSNFPIQNIHEHQVVFMRDFEAQPYEQLAVFWNRSKTGHAKHFKIEELDTQYELTCNGCYIHYLEAIQKDLDTREF